MIVFLHIHIPKNGGSTFNSILARNFGREHLSLYHEKPGYFFSNSEIEQHLSHYGRFQSIASHNIRWPFLRYQGVSYHYVTFLRHPVDRALSLYFYERRQTKGTSHCSQLSFEEYLDLRVQEDKALSNYQTYHICGGCDLEEAKDILRQFTLVGITDQYDESLVLLKKKIEVCAAFSICYTKRNVSTERYRGGYQITEDSLPSGVYQRIVALNSLDLELYDWARQSLSSQIQEYGDSFAADLQRFRELNQAFQRQEMALHRRAMRKVKSVLGLGKNVLQRQLKAKAPVG
jgi:hypothetical protein